MTLKQHQRALMQAIRRVPNETIEQLPVRTKILVPKLFSLNKHNYKKTKMKEILLMNLTPQLKKSNEKRKSDPTPIREPN